MAKPFEVGLALSGTISAGAYTAGVIDFLIQALDEWHRHKEAQEKKGIAASEDTECLRHDVELKVLTGASGGGMTAALAALALHEKHQPITSLPGNLPDADTIRANRLYDTWVKQVDAIHLLDTRDFEEDDDNSLVHSLLDSTVLDEISEQIHQKRPLKQRAYVADPFDLYLTHTNLRGVPYDVKFKGNKDQFGLRLSMHTDNTHFTVGETAPARRNGSRHLDLERSEEANWEQARRAALGTGAWPIGLRSRLLTRHQDDYLRKWPIPRDSNASDVCVRPRKIKPSWPNGPSNPEAYEYLVADGGVMNNDPVELARRCLSGSAGIRNERAPEKVRRAVIMVDPLSGSDPMTDEEAREFVGYDIVDVFLRLFSSLLNQARFKPEELMLAFDKTGYSRFLVAPRREIRRDDQPGDDQDTRLRAKHPLATASLRGFGGFLSERFRYHDFQLGRRNCQKFLRDWFALPLKAAKHNLVFEDVRPVLDDHAYIRKEDEKTVVPLIPLYGSAKDEEFPLIPVTEEGVTSHTVDRYFSLTRDERSQIEKHFKKRLKELGPRLINRRTPKGLRRVAKIALWFYRDHIAEKAMEKMDIQLASWKKGARHVM